MKAGQIAIVGRPNVGKSTLVNRLTGAKVAIVSSKPQTTRQRVRGIVTTESAQFVFVDTPGYQTRFSSPLNQSMNRSVVQTFNDVDVVVLVIEALRWTKPDAAVLALVPANQPIIVAINKVDTVTDKAKMVDFLTQLSALRPFAAFVPISAERGTQVDALLAEIEKLLPDGEPLFDADAMTDRDEKFLAAEIVREKVFRFTGDEIPYGTTAVVEKFEQEGHLRRIFISILVDDENHKPMVIGKGGQRMKKIATAAREDMVELFDGPVYLEVFVKVRSGWAQTEANLRKLGYEV